MRKAFHKACESLFYFTFYMVGCGLVIGMFVTSGYILAQ